MKGALGTNGGKVRLALGRPLASQVPAMAPDSMRRHRDRPLAPWGLPTPVPPYYPMEMSC